MKEALKKLFFRTEAHKALSFWALLCYVFYGLIAKASCDIVAVSVLFALYTGAQLKEVANDITHK